MMDATNFPAIADTFVRSGNFSNRNYGAAATVDAYNEVGTTTDAEIYYKFDASSVTAGIAKAELVLTPQSVGLPLQRGNLRLRLLADTADGWLEGNGGTDNKPAGEITWNLRPVGEGNELLVPGAGLVVNSPFVVDVTSLVKQGLNANGIASFQIQAATEAKNSLVRFHSRTATEATYQPYLRITPMTSAPTARDDGATTFEDTSVIVAVRSNDSDAEGDPLTITSVTQGARGSVTILPEGTVLYTPQPNFFGTDTFLYTITDGVVGSDGVTGSSTAAVTVTVQPLNDAPTAVNDSAVTRRNTSVEVNVLANDSDVEGSPLTVTGVDAAANGTVTILSGGRVRYTPATGFEGVDSFSYQISDGEGGTASAEVTITIPMLPRLNIQDMAIQEKGSGVTQVSFPVVLSQASTSEVTVPFATRNGSAIASVDYASAAGVLVFAPGQTTRTIVVTVYGDAVLEAIEEFYVDLGEATEAVIGDGTATGRLTDAGYRANTAPVFQGFANAITRTDSQTVVDLFAAFSDAQDSDSQLTYRLVSNSRPDLFSSIVWDLPNGKLILNHAAGMAGTSQLTLAATDRGGLTTGTPVAQGFRVYDQIAGTAGVMAPDKTGVGLARNTLWTHWYFFDYVNGRYDFSQLAVQKFLDALAAVPASEAAIPIVFDIENDYYVNTPEGRDRFAEVFHLAQQARPDLTFGLYMYVPERSWYQPVYWERSLHEQSLGISTWYTRNAATLKQDYDAWVARNELFRTQPVAPQFGGTPLADMMDNINVSLYTVMRNNAYDLPHWRQTTLDPIANRLAWNGPALENGMVLQLTVTAGGSLANGLSASRDYYAVNVTADSFQLALTAGGTPIDFTANYTGTVFAGVKGPWAESMWHDPSILDWDLYAKQNVAEGRKFGKPTYAWISPSMRGAGEDHLDQDFFRLQLEYLKDQVTGIVIYEPETRSAAFHENQGWWLAVKDFMATLDDPAATFAVELSLPPEPEPEPTPTPVTASMETPVPIAGSGGATTPRLGGGLVAAALPPTSLWQAASVKTRKTT
jgi:hypothetical protein